MQLAQVTHDRQSQAETFVLSGNRAVSLSKVVEDMRQKLRTDALTIVGDDDFKLRTRASHLNFNVSVNGRELYGIREQVPNDLLQTVGVSQNRFRLAFEYGCQLDLLRIRRGPYGIDRRFDNLGQLDGTSVQPNFPADDARNFENDIDELRLGPGIAIDNLDRVNNSILVEASAAQHVGPSHDRVQRRAQFMRNGSHKLVLDPIGGLGFGARGLFTEQ